MRFIQNHCHFAPNNLRPIFLLAKCCILIPLGPMNINAVLVQSMAWQQTATSHYHNQWCHNLPMHIYDISLSFSELTHWCQDKMAPIKETTFWNAFSWTKMYEFWLRFHWNFGTKGSINNTPTLGQIMAWRQPGWQAIIWTNDGLGYRRIYASHSLNALTINTITVWGNLNFLNLFIRPLVFDRGPDIRNFQPKPSLDIQW